MNLGTGIAIAGIWLGGGLAIGHFSSAWEMAFMVLVQALFTSALSARRRP